MAKYRKKPIIIEATKFTANPFHLIPGVYISGSYIDKDGSIVHTFAIDTLEGTMLVKDGDYIITGVEGERYPCKPSIFEATYEKIED